MKQSFNKIPIKAAFLKDALTWPGVTSAEKTVHKIKGVKMFWTPQGLLLTAQGKQTLVPHANVNNAVLAEEFPDET